jgi:DNA repair protein RecN (Recombination protein N)
MLEELSVRNFALIDSLSISFGPGLSVLSGETGAGKSIIVGSLSFLLGAKTDTEVIRSGCDEAGVEAVISISPQNREALDWLLSRDIEMEDGLIIVRRTVKASGRSSIYIQNAQLTRADLAEFMAFLFDLHGQHTHETLLKKEIHRVYLDRFAGLEDEALVFNRAFLALAEKRKALESSLSSERDRDSRLEILSYGVEEISKAAPKSGEIRELESETQRLSDFEKLSLDTASAADFLFDGETTLLSLARHCRSSMDNAAAIDGKLLPLLKRMEDLYYEAEDISAEFRSYRDSLSFDPQRLEEAGERLAFLLKLKKKYVPANPGEGSAPEEDILLWKAEAEAEIEALSGAAENRDLLKTEIAALERDLASRAAVLSAGRAEGARRLGADITTILKQLGMPNARFEAQVAPKNAKNQTPGGESEKSGLRCGPWGADDVEFLISANTGEPLKELARIASGGELSRVMLAIKTALSQADSQGAGASPETLVFDEIDTGIGGEVALSVGEYLSRIGRQKQIFCVTHLASIAVRADNHLKVEKKVLPAGRTVTELSALGSEDRRQEIARMLAGSEGAAALAHADELLAQYGRRKKNGQDT